MLRLNPMRGTQQSDKKLADLLEMLSSLVAMQGMWQRLLEKLDRVDALGKAIPDQMARYEAKRAETRAEMQAAWDDVSAALMDRLDRQQDRITNLEADHKAMLEAIKADQEAMLALMSDTTGASLLLRIKQSQEEVLLRVRDLEEEVRELKENRNEPD